MLKCKILIDKDDVKLELQGVGLETEITTFLGALEVLKYRTLRGTQDIGEDIFIKEQKKSDK